MKDIETNFHSQITFDDIKHVTVEVTDIALIENCFSWLNELTEATAELTPTDVYTLSKISPKVAQLAFFPQKPEQRIAAGNRV